MASAEAAGHDGQGQDNFLVSVAAGHVFHALKSGVEAHQEATGEVAEDLGMSIEEGDKLLFGGAQKLAVGESLEVVAAGYVAKGPSHGEKGARLVDVDQQFIAAAVDGVLADVACF